MTRNARRVEEFADRVEAADLDAENILTAREEIADVFRRRCGADSGADRQRQPELQGSLLRKGVRHLQRR